MTFVSGLAAAAAIPVHATTTTSEAEVTFYEDRTGVVLNGTIVVHFNYYFTENQQDGIEFGSTGLIFQDNGTVILK